MYGNKFCNLKNYTKYILNLYFLIKLKIIKHTNMIIMIWFINISIKNIIKW